MSVAAYDDDKGPMNVFIVDPSLGTGGFDSGLMPLALSSAAIFLLKFLSNCSMPGLVLHTILCLAKEVVTD